MALQQHDTFKYMSHNSDYMSLSKAKIFSHMIYSSSPSADQQDCLSYNTHLSAEIQSLGSREALVDSVLSTFFPLHRLLTTTSHLHIHLCCFSTCVCVWLLLLVYAVIRIPQFLHHGLSASTCGCTSVRHVSVLVRSCWILMRHEVGPSRRGRGVLHVHLAWCSDQLQCWCVYSSLLLCTQ